MEEIKQFEILFDKYDRFIDQLTSNRFHDLTSAFTDFKNRYEVFDDRMSELKQKETPFYNIFEILNIKHRETKLHTPFLVHLLDPKASHEQGSLFLDKFLKKVLKLSYHFKDMVNFEIHEELSHDQGRVDIIMLFEYEEEKKSIIIENKVYAGDQKNQLKRYYDYLIHDLQLNKENILLAYLTPRGEMPTPRSIDFKITNQLMKEKNLVLIGYQEHIISWLTECWENVKSDRVRYILIQYINTLKIL